MTSINCPSCGHELAFDVLSGEPRPCSQCGAVPEVDESGRLVPDAEHQLNISRQKFFEVSAVVVMIIVGFGYFAISKGRTEANATGSTTVTDLSAILRAENFEERDSSTALDQTFHQFLLGNAILQTSVSLVSDEGSEQTYAILISAGLPAGKTFPPDDIAEKAIQDTFDEIADLGELLVPSSTQGLSKAVHTTVPVSNGSTRLRKGVAQTSSGWKITYIAYRAMEENEVEMPLLLFIYQRLDAASDPSRQNFNQVLFTAANEGANILRAMQDLEGSESDGN